MHFASLSIGFQPCSRRLVFLKNGEADNESSSQGVDLKEILGESSNETQGQFAQTIDSLRQNIGQINEELSSLISKDSYKGMKKVAEGKGLEVTLEFLQNHPEFRPKERREALEAHEKIQIALKDEKITKAQADQLIQEFVLNRMNAKMLEGSVEFSLDYLKMVNGLLEPARKELGKSVSQTDLDYWAEHYILPHELTLKEDLPKIELKLAQKLKRRKEDKAFYDEKVKLAEKRQISLGAAWDKFSDRKVFLEASVPKRHDYLRALVLELHEWDEKTRKYTKRAQDAVKTGIMNQKTAKAFVEGFIQTDPKTREVWFNNKSEWEKREKLVTEMNALPEGSKNKAYIQEMFQLLGFTQFEALFRKNQKIHWDYMKALQGYKNDKRYNLRERTYKKYLDWSLEQPYFVLADAYNRLDHFAQMGKFKELQKRMDNLSDEQKAELEHKYNEAGYEARKKMIEEAEGQYLESSDSNQVPMGELSNISSDVLRKHLYGGLSQLNDREFNHLDQILTRVYKGSRGIQGVQSFTDGFLEQETLIAQQEAQKIQEMQQEKSSAVQLTDFQSKIRAQRAQNRTQPLQAPQPQAIPEFENHVMQSEQNTTAYQSMSDFDQRVVDDLKQNNQVVESQAQEEFINSSNEQGYVPEEFSKQSMQKISRQDGMRTTSVSGFRTVEGRGKRSAMVDLNDSVGMKDFFTADSRQAFSEKDALSFGIHTGDRRVNIGGPDMRVLLKFMSQERVRRASRGLNAANSSAYGKKAA